MPDDGLQGAGENQPLDAQILGGFTDVIQADHFGLEQHINKVRRIGVGPQVDNRIQAFDRLINLVAIIQIAHDKIGQSRLGATGKATNIMPPLEQMLAQRLTDLAGRASDQNPFGIGCLFAHRAFFLDCVCLSDWLRLQG